MYIQMKENQMLEFYWKDKNSEQKQTNLKKKHNL